MQPGRRQRKSPPRAYAAKLRKTIPPAAAVRCAVWRRAAAACDDWFPPGWSARNKSRKLWSHGRRLPLPAAQSSRGPAPREYFREGMVSLWLRLAIARAAESIGGGVARRLLVTL